MSLLFAEDVYGPKPEQQKSYVETMPFNGIGQQMDGISDYVTKNNMILAGVVLISGFAIWWNFIRRKKDGL